MSAQRVFHLSLEELESIPVVKDNGEHLILDCPYCPVYYGPSKSGKYPKLYYHKEKGVGYCFRCGTAIVVKNIPPEIRIVQKVKRNSPPPTKPPDPRAFLSSLEDLTPRGRSYLYHRSPYLQELEGLEVYSLTGEREAILIPIFWERELLGYQLRYIDGREPRYHLHTWNGKKPIYYRKKELPEGAEITINEGIFGSWGAEYLGYPHPVAIFGLSMTPYQVELLRWATPRRILVNLDSPELSWKLARKLKDALPYAKVEIVPLGDADDLANAYWKSKRSRLPAP